MAHCPECETTFTDESTVEFVEMGGKTSIFNASKRFYLVACADCGAAIGSGVAAENG